jgi:hypothetical protein
MTVNMTGQLKVSTGMNITFTSTAAAPRLAEAIRAALTLIG